VAAASSNVCGIDVLADPFWGQTNVGGTFQSYEGNGVSAPITITFAAPITAVTVTVYDPISLGTVYFPYSGTGGVNVPSTRTIAHAGVRRVDLLPAPEDYVAYDVGFDTAPQPPEPPPCPFPVLSSYDSITTQFGSIDATHKKPHTGRDYKVASGTPIYAADSGTVIWSENTGKAGMVVVVRSGNVNTYYMHMQSFSVREHQHVEPGQRLGYSDNTGESTGPHLHLEQHSPAANWPWDSGGLPPRSTNVAPCTI